MGKVIALNVLVGAVGENQWRPVWSVPEFADLTCQVAELRPNKQFQFGLIESYSVHYLGGYPDYPKAKAGGIDLKIFPDRFELWPTFGSAWFRGALIPFDRIYSLNITQRQVGAIEGLIAGGNVLELQQNNNINISYHIEYVGDILLRIEMLSGVSVFGQANKCRELLDRMRTHGIFGKFRARPHAPSVAHATVSAIPEQLQQLARLRDQGIVTNDEFERKKTELLSRM